MIFTTLPLSLSVVLLFVCFVCLIILSLPLFTTDRERIVERTSVYIYKSVSSACRSGKSHVFSFVFSFRSAPLARVCLTKYLKRVRKTNTISTSDGSSSDETSLSTFWAMPNLWERDKFFSWSSVLGGLWFHCLIRWVLLASRLNYNFFEEDIYGGKKREQRNAQYK